MQRSSSAVSVASLFAAAALLVACAGTRDGPTSDTATGGRLDSGGGGQRDATAPKPDSAAPKPDSGSGSTPGSPCPCTGNYQCVLNACRAPCTPAQCNEGGPCGASEACVQLTGGSAVCVPARGEGQTCDTTSNVCASGLLCLAIQGGGSDRCWRSCTKTPCGSGANPKCWDISGTSCKYCGPN